MDDKPDKLTRARREQSLFILKWQSPLQVDPYYHPALCADFLNGPYGALACPPAPLIPRL